MERPKILIVITITLIVLIAGCKSEENEDIFINEPNNFRGLDWGTKFQDLEGFEILDAQAAKFNIPHYYAKKLFDDLKYEGVKVSEISYGFDEP